jgi:hypothetical protein
MSDLQQKLTVTIEVDRRDFIGEILGSAFEYWSWWHVVRYDEGYEWDRYPDDNNKKFLWLGICDPDDPNERKTIRKKVSVNDIAKAYAKSGYRSYDNLDAGSSDWIMQHIFFDEAVYA